MASSCQMQHHTRLHRFYLVMHVPLSWAGAMAGICGVNANDYIWIRWIVWNITKGNQRGPIVHTTPRLCEGRISHKVAVKHSRERLRLVWLSNCATYAPELWPHTHNDPMHSSYSKWWVPWGEISSKVDLYENKRAGLSQQSGSICMVAKRYSAGLGSQGHRFFFQSINATYFPCDCATSMRSQGRKRHVRKEPMKSLTMWPRSATSLEGKHPCPYKCKVALI